jgi:hypothetical protein
MIKARFLRTYRYKGETYERLKVYDLSDDVFTSLAILGRSSRRTAICVPVEAAVVEARENASKKVKHVKRTRSRNRANS